MAFGDDAFGFADPTTMALMGALQGVSQYAGASRLPQTFGQALGGAAGGMLGGIQAGQKYQLGQQQIGSEAIKNAASLDLLRRQAAAFGQPMPSLGDVKSGKYQGPDWSSLFSQMQQPTAAPQFPQAGGATAAPGVTAGPDQQIPSVGQHRISPVNTTYTAPPPGTGGALRTAAERYAAQYNVDPNFYSSLIYGESRFDPNATGPATTGGGEAQERPLGIAQIKPSTAKSIGIDNPLDPAQGLDGGAKYFASLLQNNDGDYVKATQAYGTIPHDLSKMDGNQAMVYHAAVAANGGAQPTAQNAAQPSASAAYPEMSPMEAFRQQALMGAFGMKIPEPVQDYLSAMLVPPGPMRDLGISAAYNKAGLGPKELRVQGTLWQVDPRTGQWSLKAQSPALGRGQMLSQTPGGGYQSTAVPGALPGIAAEHAAEAGGTAAGGLPYVEPTAAAHAAGAAGGALPFVGPTEAARAGAAGQFETTTVYDQFGNPRVIPRSQIPQALGGQQQPASPQPTAPPAPMPGTSLVPGGAMPSSTVSPQAGQPAVSPQTPEAATPTFTANTPTGQKPINQVTIDDMFPNGAGIPQPRGPAGPVTEFQKKVQGDDADRLESYNKEQAANQQINQDLLRLRGVLDRGFTTSNAAHIGSALANVAHGLGADWAYPRGWAPASAAEFDKASTDLVFAALKALPGQPRVSEIVGLQKANPNILIPRETNYQMTNDILARSKWQDERSRLATDFTVTHKGVPLAVFDSAYNRMAPLPDVANEYMGILRQHGAVFPEDVKAGGGPVAPGSTSAVPQMPSMSKTIGGTTYHKVGNQWFPEVK